MAGAALICSCAAARAPQDVAARYAEALRDGKLDAAYELMDEKARPDAATFHATYANPETRRRRAEAILQSLEKLRASSDALELVRQGGEWRVADPPPEIAARKALERFLSAVEARNFVTVYGCLAQPLRDRYTPARLEKDFGLEPQAKRRVARVQKALEEKVELEVSREGAQLPLGEGRAVRLVKEGDSYRIAALE